jgi:hypothetical protein
MVAISMKEALGGRFRKEEMIELINSNAGFFTETLALSQQALHPVSWRAAWMLYHCMEAGDPRLQPKLQNLIQAIPGKPDGHQRELLRIIERLDYPEETEGVLFDLCMNLWEQPGKIPSLRLFALRIVLRIAAKYPELNNEIAFVTQPHYLEGLSPGIGNAVQRMIKEAVGNVSC